MKRNERFVHQSRFRVAGAIGTSVSVIFHANLSRDYSFFELLEDFEFLELPELFDDSELSDSGGIT